MTREQELRQQIAEIFEAYQRAYMAEAQPLIDELVRIESRKPPLPVKGPDGQVWYYVRPLP